MNQRYRLPIGGRIDRTRPLLLQFDGKTIEGFSGDTVASALLANGVRLVGRSFKYHRPRGILSHGVEEPNALLQVDRGPGRLDPNNRATVVEATDGLVVRSQNRWPSLRNDFGAVNDLLSPLFVAGFYYKTFMWPRAFWDWVYEPRIRAAAGLGVAPSDADADRYVHRHAHCDVLVIGAGPAGIAAAMAASQRADRVTIVDEQSEAGGSLLHEVGTTIDGVSASEWLKQALETLRTRSNVTLLTRTSAFGYYNHNHIALLERVTDHHTSPTDALPRERLWQIRARQVVLATGSHERPLVFAKNDRPGIMLAESVRVFVNRYGVAPGGRIVFVTNGASAYRAAADCKAVGIDVKIVDVRPESECGVEVALLRDQGVEVLTGHTVLRPTGRRQLTGLVVAPIDSLGKQRTLRCDCAGLSGGWTPAVHLFSQSRGKLRFDESIAAFVPNVSVQAERSAGAAKGTFDLAECLAEGWHVGMDAAGASRSALTSIAPDERKFTVQPATLRGFAPTTELPTDADPARVRAFVDFQNDVTAKDIRLAVREGFESVEHVKRYTTNGMATDQGKTSNMPALGVLSQALSRPIPQVGTTTFRPPYTPVSFGAFAGTARNELFDPICETPTHDWAVQHGAKFENVGLWKRAWYFPKGSEDIHAATHRECLAVRNAVGMVDASTLGKIEVVGPDAAEFLNRFYVNNWTNLEPGRCRYGLLLREDGYVFDDGVVTRLERDRFHVTTTTGGAARVLALMEDYAQTEWPNLEVFLTSTTEQWAVIAVQGPKARQVLAPLVEGIDLSAEAFPHMSVRVGHIGEVPTRLFRVSFTGEIGYEVNVPAAHGLAIWEAIYASGKAHGITPYGTNALHVLRAERGFIIVGQDTDGTVTPDDIGLGSLIAKNKSDFVGKRSLARPDLKAPGRKQLVGLLTEQPNTVLDEGAQVVAIAEQEPKMKSLGHVTSSYSSPTCKRSIALALVANGRALIGRSMRVTTLKGFTTAQIVAPVFYDAKGERVHG